MRNTTLVFHPPSLRTSSGSGGWIWMKRLRGESWPSLSPEKRDHYRVSLGQKCREDGVGKKKKKKGRRWRQELGSLLSLRHAALHLQHFGPSFELVGVCAVLYVLEEKKKKTQDRLCFSDPVGRAQAKKDRQFALHCSDKWHKLGLGW